MADELEKYLSKPTKKRHRRSLRILLIPDDQAEPRAYSLSMRQLRFAKVLVVLLACHIVFGFYAYSALSRYLVRVHSLEQINRQLSENNQRIYELANEFKNLEDTDGKIRAALGLSGPGNSGANLESMAGTTSLLPQRTRLDNQPASMSASANASQIKVGERLNFLQQNSQNGLHDYLRSVPTYLPVEGVLTNDYQQDAKSQGVSTHNGIDIAAPRGSFVRASADGIVIFAGWTEDLGHLVVLYHGNGYFTYYGHNQRLLVMRNRFVRKAEEIAMVGSSGESSAPHLHFEIWKDGLPLDPKQYILAFSGM
jgi:murein DD-endopeptidase MepM/ murein hydrolase activator NlpD